MNRISIIRLALISFLFTLYSCTPKTAKQLSGDDGKMNIAIVQLNDVYEIAGVEGGKYGNLARVANYIRQIRNKYPQTLVVMAGDFLNPSLINTLKYEGERIRGKQMIEVLNALPLDVAAFGNHEFDFDLEDLQARINESNFTWIATNLARISGDERGPFYKEVEGKRIPMPQSKSYAFRDADGTSVSLGIFSATIASNPRDYVRYLNADSCALQEIQKLRAQDDLVIGLTHLSMPEDIALAKQAQHVDMIMGGHEHDHRFEQVGKVQISKADANAKTLYLHVLSYDKRTKKLDIQSDLVTVDAQMGLDPEVGAIVARWDKILENEVKQVVAKPFEVVYKTQEILDGRESSIRHEQGKLGELCAQAMKHISHRKAEIAFINSGSFRIDDQLSGEILGIDIFRTLPFGGSVWEADMKGSLIQGIMRYSESHKGTGAYLQYAGLEKSGDDWLVNGNLLDTEKYYRVILNDFLLKGYDIPFLKEDNTGIKQIYKPIEGIVVDNRSDIRAVIIGYLKGLE